MKPLRPHVVALASTKSSVYTDPEFGDIAYKRIASARYVRIRMTSSGAFRATLPSRAPLSSLVALIESSRETLRGYAADTSVQIYVDGQRVGQSHHIQVARSRGALRVSLSGQSIIVGLTDEMDIAEPFVQTEIRGVALKALRVEAKAYLPRRLAYLAEQYGFSYEKLRFAHQSSRWGSCSSRGTISLNIALMNVPFEVIDYVLVHELAHTKHMNHSTEFWREVEGMFPDYKNARRTLKKHNPKA